MADLIFGKKDGVNYVGVIEKYNPDGSMEISTSGHSECDWKNMDSIQIIPNESSDICYEDTHIQSDSSVYEVLKDIIDESGIEICYKCHKKVCIK